MTLVLSPALASFDLIHRQKRVLAYSVLVMKVVVTSFGIGERLVAASS
jgi:hypothetical protein